MDLAICSPSRGPDLADRDRLAHGVPLFARRARRGGSKIAQMVQERPAACRKCRRPHLPGANGQGVMMRIRLTAAIAAIAVLASMGTARAQPGPPGPPAVGVVAAQKRRSPRPASSSAASRRPTSVDLVARVHRVPRRAAVHRRRRGAEGRPAVPAGARAVRGRRCKPSKPRSRRSQAHAAQRHASTLDRARSRCSTRRPASAPPSMTRIANQASSRPRCRRRRRRCEPAQINLDYTEIHAPIDGKIAPHRRSPTATSSARAPARWPRIVSQDPMYVTVPGLGADGARPAQSDTPTRAASTPS